MLCERESFGGGVWILGEKTKCGATVEPSIKAKNVVKHCKVQVTSRNMLGERVDGCLSVPPRGADLASSKDVCPWLRYLRFVRKVKHVTYSLKS